MVGSVRAMVMAEETQKLVLFTIGMGKCVKIAVTTIPTGIVLYVMTEK